MINADKGAAGTATAGRDRTMTTMGSDWWWSLSLPPGSLTADLVEAVLALAGNAGLSPHRPDGAINGFRQEGDPLLLDHRELVAGLAAGTLATNLWNSAGVDIWLATDPETATVALSLDSCWTWRSPVPEAEPYRRLHGGLTDLWVAVAERTGALFGRVEDEWSLEQVHPSLPHPVSDAPPPPGRRPDRMGWWTYVTAELYRRMPPLPPGIDATVRRTSSGAAVIALLDDPAAVDPLAFERFHLRHRA